MNPLTSSPIGGDEDVKPLKDALDRLERDLEISNENGFLRNQPDKYNEILILITGALQNLSQTSPDTVESRKKYSQAYNKYNEGINSMCLGWRFQYVYGGYILIYLLGLLFSISLAWVFKESFRPSFSKIFWVPSWAYVWGAIGGILQGLWMIWQYVSGRYFRRGWISWFIVLPLMGAIFGALTYLIFLAGFIIATGGANITTSAFIMLLCALAGFNSLWIIKILNQLTELIHVGSSSKS